MPKPPVVVSFLPDDLNSAADYLKVYMLINHDFVSPIELPKLDKSNSVCRYCKKSTLETTFKSEAHTIPEFLGNHFNVSDFECDRCNNKFSRIEKQLFNYLGVHMTLNKTKGKKDIPTILSHDTAMAAKRVDFFDDKEAVQFGSTTNSTKHISYNKDTRTHTVEFITQPYIPYNVYKALLKIALGLLPEKYLKEYDFAFEMLQDFSNKKPIQGHAITIYTYNISIPYARTGVFLLKRIDDNGVEPPLSFILIYEQLMIQISIPFNEEYLKKIKKHKEIKLYLLPPMLPFDEAISLTYNVDYEKADSLVKNTKNQYVNIIKDKIKEGETLVAIDFETKKEIEGAVFNHESSVNFIFSNITIKPNSIIYKNKKK